MASVAVRRSGTAPSSRIVSTRLRSRAWSLSAGLLAAAFVAAAGAISAFVPAFEAPDEPAHFGYVRYLVAHQGIPPLNAGTTAAHEAGQAPLYYLVAALATLPAGDWTAQPTRLPTWDNYNPHASFEIQFGQTPDLGDRNLYAHAAKERAPFQGDALALHLARLVSVVFGALAVVATLLTARELFPKRPALTLAAGSLLALNPQFVFISAVASNDSAAAGTACLTFFLLVRALRRGLTRARAAGIGVALGLAILAKLSLLALIPFVGLALLLAVDVRSLRDFRTSRLREHLPSLATLALAAALVGGWWYALNLIWYGDPTAWQPMLVAQGTMIRATPISPFEAASALFAARDTYWATFGWTNVLATPWVYAATDALVVVALAGLALASALGVRRLLSAASRPHPWLVRLDSTGLTLLLMAAWTVAIFVSLVRWVQLNTAAAQGRLLFPAAGAVAILLAVGLARFVPRRAEALLPLLLTLGLVLVDRSAFLGALGPAYQPPTPVPAADLAKTTPLDGVCDCGIEFVGYTYNHLPQTPDDVVSVDFYWRLAERSGAYQDRDWSFHVGLLDPSGGEKAKTVSWPDAGRLPTTAATVGATYRQRVELKLPPTDAAPGVGTFTVTPFYSRDGSAELGKVSTKSGQPLGTSVKLGAFRWPAAPITAKPARTLGAKYANGLQLLGADVPESAQPGAALPVRLYWKTDRPLPRNFAISVQVVDEQGKGVGQIDSQPRGERYPMTYWVPGEVVVDDRTVPLKAATGTLRVRVVVYDKDTGERLEPAAGPGYTVENQMIEAARVQIGR